MSKKEWPLWEVFIRGQHGLNHRHVGSLHAPDAEMAINHARDVYTRRKEGVSIWVVAVEGDHSVQPVREGPAVRPGRKQDLPPPDLLRYSGRSGENVMSDQTAASGASSGSVRFRCCS
jgi:ring-1,2-phenylacetyl-CoA epoxidase subunit PaaB